MDRYTATEIEVENNIDIVFSFPPSLLLFVDGASLWF